MANQKTRSLIAAASLGAFGTFAAIARARLQSPGPLLTPANLLTLSRAGAASSLCGYAASPRPGGHRTVVWLTLLWAATVTDWLDGPLARQSGVTPLGAVLDLEADSWLTLWAAVAAWRSGSLPATCVAAPAMRYAVRWRRGLSLPMATAGWQKAAGAAQMAVIAAGLAPNRFIRGLARRLLPCAVVAQLVALAADARPAVPASRSAPAA
jgi:phosphatidylglycerophosphate synthase